MYTFVKQLLIVFIALISLNSCNGFEKISIVSNGHSDYKIILPANPLKNESKAAAILQDYIKRTTGVFLQITRDARSATHGIYVGHTIKTEKIKKIKGEGFLIMTSGADLVIAGGSGKGVLYGAYTFVEKYLGCRKYSEEPAMVPAIKELSIDTAINDLEVPGFTYRQAYYPESHDVEYLDWHKLQSLEDLWGIWGHSFDKLVPAEKYFKTNPQYYSLINGHRKPVQLCLSNDTVYQIAVADLKRRMAKNPDAMYWSISQNDDNYYCQCDRCKATDNAEGGPQGSLIRFVNRIAATFADKNFTTLAYAYSHKPTIHLRPAPNVYILLSTIEAFRDQPLADDGSAKAFRSDLAGWRRVTDNIFIWDYTTQFTNYLAPFPNITTLGPNISYFKSNGVSGIFEQGSGDTYGELAELKSYVLAKALWDPKVDTRKVTTDFIKGFYGPAALFIQQYVDFLHEQMELSKRKLDIYGNPITEANSYLSPVLLEQYSTLLDKADISVEAKPVYAARVRKVRLALDYTVLQQARGFGIDKFGIFEKDQSGTWVVRTRWPSKVADFVANCKKAGVTELSEGGPDPDKYQAQWNKIFIDGVKENKALHASVKLDMPYRKEFPARGEATLVDGNPGYDDYSYNWLCFYNTDMIATIDMGSPISVSSVSMHFLDDPRHWIFTPASVSIQLSEDGVKYTTIGNVAFSEVEEHYNLSLKDCVAKTATKKARYVKVTATKQPGLPAWRYSEIKMPTIACDEIYVQ
ncbi:MAG: DUF4838 domain-containing protein [Taibaiella sp.]|nr:DUF4838 domain-containing protein [Taibaiella sp.]